MVRFGVVDVQGGERTRLVHAQCFDLVARAARDMLAAYPNAAGGTR